MDIFISLGLIIIAVITATILKSQNSEYRIVFIIAVSIAILFSVISEISPIFEEIFEICTSAKLNNTYIVALIKSLGICYITEFASETCKDAGELSLSSKAQLCGRVSIVIIALPLVKEILDVAISVLGV